MDMNAYRKHRQRVGNVATSIRSDNPYPIDGILQCDLCGSTSVEINNGENVCSNCGMVLDEKVYGYTFPREDGVKQFEKDRGENTTIGTDSERKACKDSSFYSKLNKIHRSNDNEKNLLIKAKVEVNRIFNSLNLPYRLKTFAFQKFKTIRGSLKPNTKFRSPEKLVPVVTYMCMKFLNISIDENKLLEVSSIDKKDFKSFKLLIGKYYPEYYTRNRKEYILRKVSELVQYYAMEFESRGMEFYHLSSKILNKFWDQISCTSDNVVAGLISSLSLLTAFKDIITVNKICKKLDIKMSTVQTQVKKNFIARYNVSGFKSLVKSADLLKEILTKLGILESEDQDEIEVNQEIRDYLNQNF